MKKGFKIVTKELKSYVMDFKELACVQYSKKWAKRRKGCGPLAVFSTEKAAKKFIDFEMSFNGAVSPRLFECRYTVPKVRCKGLWDSAEAKRDYIYGRAYLPKGTVFADRVKLVKEIK